MIFAAARNSKIVTLQITVFDGGNMKAFGYCATQWGLSVSSQYRVLYLMRQCIFVMFVTLVCIYGILLCCIPYRIIPNAI